MNEPSDGLEPNARQPFNWKNYSWVLLLILVLAGIWLRNTQRGFESYDMLYDFIPWAREIRANDGLYGLATLKSDYPPSFLFILALLTYLPGSIMAKIKVVSLVYELLTMLIIYLYVKQLYPKPRQKHLPFLAAGLYFFLPTVILNGAVWGQVDSIYTFFVVSTLYWLSREKYNLTYIAYGIALASKLQAIFLLPFLGMHYLKRKKYSFVYIFWVPAIYVIIGIPAMILGRSPADVFLVYFEQMGEYPRTVFNFGNIYNFLPDNYELLAIPGILFTLFLLFLGLHFILKDRSLKLTKFNFPDFAMLSILICASFLPGMHERYMYAAVVISVLYLFAHPRQFYIPLLLWLIEPNAYIPVLWEAAPILDYRLSALLLILLIGLTIYHLKPRAGHQAGKAVKEPSEF